MLCPIFLFDTQKISTTYFDKEFCYQSIDRTLNSLIRIRVVVVMMIRWRMSNSCHAHACMKKNAILIDISFSAVSRLFQFKQPEIPILNGF